MEFTIYVKSFEGENFHGSLRLDMLGKLSWLRTWDQVVPYFVVVSGWRWYLWKNFNVKIFAVSKIPWKPWKFFPSNDLMYMVIWHFDDLHTNCQIISINVNFPDNISPGTISFIKLKFFECYFEVNSSNLFPVNISSYI